MRLGYFVDKMPASVEKMMVENLIKGYVPKKVEAKIPTLIFYALGIPTLQNGYTEEQKAAFDQYYRNVSGTCFQVCNFRISKQIPSCEDSRDPRWASLLFHGPGGTGP